MLTIEEVSATTDFGELTTLLNENRLPGQPPVTDAMVQATFTRDAAVDQWYYEQLVETHILAVRDQSRRLVGAVAYGDARQGVRDLLWLAASEPAVIAALVDAVFADWNGPSRAFWYASTVSAGLEGLPRQHRSDVHDVLVSRGFLGRDLWSYQLLPVTTPNSKCDVGFTKKGVVSDAHGAAVAQYEIAIPYEGLGVLWWIETNEDHRGHGHGRVALDEALSALAAHGATEVMLYVDDDDLAGERDRRPAKALYAAAGFREVDRLWSYSKGDVPPEDSTS